jgi:hypothetical protein
VNQLFSTQQTSVLPTLSITKLMTESVYFTSNYLNNYPTKQTSSHFIHSQNHYPNPPSSQATCSRCNTTADPHGAYVCKHCRCCYHSYCALGLPFTKLNQQHCVKCEAVVSAIDPTFKVQSYHGFEVLCSPGVFDECDE